MEIIKPQSIIENVLAKPEIAGVFNEADLEKLIGESVKILGEILGAVKIGKVTFGDDHDMFCRLDGSEIHIGLGMLEEMIKVWRSHPQLKEKNETTLTLEELLKAKVSATLHSDAAHEAGHAVIDLNPVTDLGLPPETWGTTGLSSLANALMDCRNDSWIMSKIPQHAETMRAGLDFNLADGGRQDWHSRAAEKFLENGYHPQFVQLDFELMRLWATDQVHPDTPAKIREIVEGHRPDLAYITSHQECLPGVAPSRAEKEHKARACYTKIGEVFNGRYSQLLEEDRDNQAIHQALSLIGFFEYSQKLPPALEDLLLEHLETLSEPLWQELIAIIMAQKAAKKTWRENNPEALVEDTVAAVAVTTANPSPQDLPSGASPSPTENSHPSSKKPYSDAFYLLGPAIPVEPLSPDLRDFLKKLFEAARQTVEQNQLMQLLAQLLQQILGNPEGALKEIEDQFNAITKPKTIPGLTPTHQDLANPTPATAQPAPPSSLSSQSPLSHNPFANLKLDLPTRRELEETEVWLEGNVDVRGAILDWREAIYATTHGGVRESEDPTTELNIPGIIRNKINKMMGVDAREPLYLEEAERREKIILSILWRTQANTLSQALKLILFLKKVYEDPEIRKNLDLEVLVSQQIPGLPHDAETLVPVIMEFGQDPILDHEAILGNLLKLEKYGQSDSSLPITGDADALKIQRERLLRRSPGSKRRYLIDLWDEAAIQEDCEEKYGTSSPTQAVEQQIAETQASLNGRAFCFILRRGARDRQSSHRGNLYGPQNYLMESDSERLIRYLDIVIRTMIRFPRNFSKYITEEIDREMRLIG